MATHVEALAGGLIRTGRFFVDVVCSGSHAGMVEKDVQGSLAVYRLQKESVPAYSGRRVPCQEVIQLLLERWRDDRKPSLIHAHDFDSVQAGSIAARALRVPLVATIHRAVVEAKDGSPSGAKEAYLHGIAALGSADHPVAPSDAALRALSGYGFPANRISRIYHGIHVGYLASINRDPALLAKAGIRPREYYLCPVRGDEHKDPMPLRPRQLVMTTTREDPMFGSWKPLPRDFSSRRKVWFFRRSRGSRWRRCTTLPVPVSSLRSTSRSDRWCWRRSPCDAR